MKRVWQFLLLAVLIPATLRGAEPAPPSRAGNLSPIAKAEWNYAHAAHLLERAGFGGTPEEIEKLAQMTPAGGGRFAARF